MTDAAGGSLVQSLLLAQRRRRDPYEDRREYGSRVMQQGASTAPVQSWGEGLARALTGGIGGYFAGEAEREEKARDQKTVDAMVAALGAKDTAGATTALKTAGADPQVLGPLLGGMLSQQMADRRKAELGQRSYQAAGGSLGPGFAPPDVARATAMPKGDPIAVAPLPEGTTPGSGFANNAGNIRASNISWEGKGTPHNGFETFATPQAGANAMFKNFAAYAQQNPGMTVAQAIAKWAPPNENDTQGYVRRLAESTGINPGMPLGEVIKDQAVMATLMDGVTRVEKGGLPQGFTADTFMQAAAPQPMQGTQPVAQGGGQAMPPAAAPPRPSFDPGADFEGLGQRAAAAGDYETATKYQMEANKLRSQFKAEQFKEEDKRTFEAQENDRRKAFDNTTKLRGDFEGIQQVKDYRKARGVMQSAVDALGTNSAAADLNLVYAFATMMDPGSVVREGEMGMVKATQSASDQVKALVSVVSGGQRISPEARAALADQMWSRFSAYKAAHDELGTAYGGIATRGGYRPEDVVIPMPEVKYEPRKKSGLPKPGDMLDGWRFKGGDPSQQGNWEKAQ